MASQGGGPPTGALVEPHRCCGAAGFSASWTFGEPGGGAPGPTTHPAAAAGGCIGLASKCGALGGGAVFGHIPGPRGADGGGVRTRGRPTRTTPGGSAGTGGSPGMRARGGAGYIGGAGGTRPRAPSFESRKPRLAPEEDMGVGAAESPSGPGGGHAVLAGLAERPRLRFDVRPRADARWPFGPGLMGASGATLAFCGRRSAPTCRPSLLGSWATKAIFAVPTPRSLPLPPFPGERPFARGARWGVGRERPRACLGPGRCAPPAFWAQRA